MGMCSSLAPKTQCEATLHGLLKVHPKSFANLEQHHGPHAILMDRKDGIWIDNRAGPDIIVPGPFPILSLVVQDCLDRPVGFL